MSEINNLSGQQVYDYIQLYLHELEDDFNEDTAGRMAIISKHEYENLSSLLKIIREIDNSI